MKKYIFISFLIFFLISCHQKKVKRYYDTGELKYEKYFSSKDSNTFYVKEFYKNGVLKQEGNIKKYNLPVGHWKENYSDGVLKYECDYIDGKAQLQNLTQNGSWPNLEYISKNSKFEIVGNTDTLKIGHQYKLRLLMKNVCPEMYIILDKNLEILKQNQEDSDRYPFIYTPNELGKIYFLVVFSNKDGYFILGNPSIIIDIGQIGNVYKIKINKNKSKVII
jgi:hypothetical protein